MVEPLWLLAALVALPLTGRPVVAYVSTETADWCMGATAPRLEGVNPRGVVDLGG